MPLTPPERGFGAVAARDGKAADPADQPIEREIRRQVSFLKETWRRSSAVEQSPHKG